MVARTSQTSSARPERPSSAIELRGEFDHVDFIAVRNECEYPRPLRDRALRGCCAVRRRAQSCAMRERELRGLRSGGIQNGIRKEQQLRVTQRNHRGAARFLQQPAGLSRPTRRARPRPRCVRPIPCAPRAGRSPPDILRPAWCRTEQQIARRQREMDGAGRERLENRGRHALQLGCYSARQSMARRNSCVALDRSSSRAMSDLAAGRGGSFNIKRRSRG